MLGSVRAIRGCTHRRTNFVERVAFKLARQSDVQRILRASQAAERFRISPYTWGIDEEELDFWVNDPRSIVIVAEVGDKLAGFAFGFAVSPKWFLFDTFLVTPGFRGRGVGKEMYLYLRSLCVSRGLELIQGLVTTGPKNTLGYWAARGFEEGALCKWVEDWLDD